VPGLLQGHAQGRLRLERPAQGTALALRPLRPDDGQAGRRAMCLDRPGTFQPCTTGYKVMTRCRGGYVFPMAGRLGVVRTLGEWLEGRD